MQTQNENNDIGKSILVSDTILGEEAKISSAQIIQRKTGIGPFDENDEAGMIVQKVTILLGLLIK